MKSTMKKVIANSGRKLFNMKRYKRLTILIWGVAANRCGRW